MKDKICIFAGTAEGRRLAELLSGCAEVTACVATEYGEAVLDNVEGIRVLSGRMDRAQMESFLSAGGFDRVIDATHPYASDVTANIAAAAEKADIPVMRILREADSRVNGAVYVSSVKEARDYLAERGGNILITTGSKELGDFSGLDMSRVWARVLPLASSLDACEKIGIRASNIIAAQGPFTYEMNLAQLRQINAGYMVTKSSGRSGGFEEKINAALDAGAVPVIIGRPPQVSGLTLDEAIAVLTGIYELSERGIALIGVGTGSRELMTAQAEGALEACDAVIGAASVVKPLDIRKPCYYEYLPDRVRAVLDGHPSIRSAAVLLRGDTGFFSGAKGLLNELRGYDITVIPGISSVSYLAAKLGVSHDGAACISVHGRESNFVRTVDRSRRTFILCGGDNTAQAVCRRLSDFGLGGLICAVGERLSYPEERITRGTAEELAEGSFDPLSVLYIDNPLAVKRIPFGIPDDAFVRGGVPMTKAEVRAVTLSKLCLDSDSTVWDIGAGTGSVSVECALAAGEGRVYAVERDREAAELIRKNSIAFHADNIEVIEGEAPGALCELPAPTHVFIGGSSGRTLEIISEALRMNPGVRIVLNAVTLEAQAEALRCGEIFGFETFEAVSVGISRSREVGRYHMMNALNPVTVFTMQGGRSRD